MKAFEVVDRLATIRKGAGIPGPYLSVCIGKKREYINHMERGDFVPSLQVVLDILEIFEIQPVYFFSNKHFTEIILDKARLCKIQNKIIDMHAEIIKNKKN